MVLFEIIKKSFPVPYTIYKLFCYSAYSKIKIVVVLFFAFFPILPVSKPAHI